MKRVAVIGAGLQARRRVPPIVEDPDFEVALVVDLYEENAKTLAATCGARYSTDWKEAVNDPAIDAVLVLTFPDTHAEISIAAMEAGKDVLCEKPLARVSVEAQQMVETAQKNKRILKCAFNLRHHPALVEAHRLYTEGVIGAPAFGRAKYGIAGRADLAQEWRSKPSVSGGGQFMDQGVHLIDLFRWFLGDVKQVSGMAVTTCWPIQPNEDNGFALMKFEGDVVASIHTSLTQWINTFEFELYGSEGSLTVKGLGGAYGVETLQVSKRDPDGLFNYNTFEYRRGDDSWTADWKEFRDAVLSRKEPSANGLAGWRALEVVEAVYSSSKTGQAVQFNH